MSKEKKNFIWNFIGAMAFGFTSLIFMMITTRTQGIDDAGLFSYCFALASIFYTIGSYSAKTYQITESDKKIADSDYIYSRLFTTGLMLLLTIIFSLISKYDTTKFLLLFILTSYRAVDIIIDCLHAIIQRNGELYKVGISLFIRTIILTIIFLIISINCKNILLPALGILLSNILYFLFVDISIAKKFIKLNKFNYNNFKSLLKKGFSIACYYFLAIFAVNIPRYLIDYLYTNEAQAIFGIIVLPASFMSLIALYITQPFLNEFTDSVVNNKYDNLLKLVYKIIAAIFAIGIIALLCAYFLGVPVLEFIYGIKLTGQKLNLSLIIIGSILYSITTVLSGVIITLRKNYLQLIILITSSLISLVAGYYLVSKYAIMGGSITYLLIMSIEFILYFIVTIGVIKKRIKREGKFYDIRL